jgi:N-carbamoylputrescine amidase
MIEGCWRTLCKHAAGQHSELVVLPEFAFAPPVWELQNFEQEQWRRAEAASERWLGRLPELRCAYVIGTRPITRDTKPYNEGFLWSARGGYTALRKKHFLPNETNEWEARWFTPGDAAVPKFAAADFSFGLNICTELWALETYSRYASMRVDAVISPRATAHATIEKWIAVGVVAAVRCGAHCISSNRVQPDGSCGGVGWIIDPDGHVLAKTSPQEPYCTRDVPLDSAALASRTYPRYVFENELISAVSRDVEEVTRK